MAVKVYYEEVDALKGVAILGIVLLHGLISSPIDINGGLGVYGNIVRSFPLYLFFTISGFFFYPSANTTWKEFLIKKSKRLLIPMFFFHSVIIILETIKRYITGGGLDGCFLQGFESIILGKHYWYLYSLFILLVVNKFADSLKYGKLVVALVLLAVDLLFDIQTPCLPINRAIHFNLFFYIGVCLSEKYNSLKLFVGTNKKLVVVLVLILFVMIFFLFATNHACIVLNGYVLPLLEVVFLWLFVLLWNNCNNGLLIHFGKYSLQYYCNHVPIMSLGYLFVGQVYEVLNSFVLTYTILVLYTIVFSFFALAVEKKPKRLHLLFGL